MSDSNTCPQEPLILAAIGNEMSESDARHLENCSSCREARSLAENMRQLATRHIAALPPDPDIIWVMAQLSKPHTHWNRETIGSIAVLAASALLALWISPAVAGYLLGIMPTSDPTANIFLTSCIVAAAIAGVTAKSIRRLTGEGN